MKLSTLIKVAIGLIFIVTVILFERNELLKVKKNEALIADMEQKLIASEVTNDSLKQSILNIEKNSSDIEQKLNASEVTIESLNQSIANMQKEATSLSQTNSIVLERTNNLLAKLPQVSKKLAFIKQTTETDGKVHAILDYVEKLSGNDASKAYMEDNKVTQEEADAFAESLPSGHYLRNKQVEQDQVQIESDAIIYGIYTDSGFEPTLMSLAGLITYTQNHKDSMFWVYIINEKIVYMTEQYES